MSRREPLPPLAPALKAEADALILANAGLLLRAARRRAASAPPFAVPGGASPVN